MTHPLAGERIGILGLARSGAAAARLALRRGAEVYASDAADTPGARANAEEIRALGGAAEVGGHDVDRLARSGRIVLSPGIPPSEGILGDSAIVGIPVIAEIEFAFEQLDAAVIAITGTNGKTTTTALLDHLLHTAGIDAVAGGNIGTALSEVALREPPPAWAVVEVSSFQLAGTVTFRPRIGVVTNLAPDHLDRYSGVEAYYADKARLFQTATAHSRWVLNGEDERVRALPGDAPGDRYYFRVASPLTLGERGGWLTEDGWLALNLEDGETRLLPAREMG
nr:Mur ligase family protein [Gemmatimonadota bacterium]